MLWDLRVECNEACAVVYPPNQAKHLLGADAALMGAHSALQWYDNQPALGTMPPRDESKGAAGSSVRARASQFHNAMQLCQTSAADHLAIRNV